MKKVFTDELPHRGKFINWKASVGYIIKFIYDNIQGEIKIIGYYRKNKRTYLKVQYKNAYNRININELIKCKLGVILGLKNYNYKYQVGDIITNIKSGKLEIVKQIRMKNGKNMIRGYKYKCLNCGNEDVVSEYDLKRLRGCNVCCSISQKILIGYNDIATTNKKLFKLLLNPNDGYKYTQNSHVYVDWKCPNCGNIIKHKTISKINKSGLSCPRCSDGISYPEKIMRQILDQLRMNFIYQYNPKWCKYKLNNKNKKGRYDFYFELNNRKYIIETDGDLGHGNKDNSLNGQTKEESKFIDDEKDKLAKENNIKVIRIDCRKSNLEYIKNNVLNSKLNELFNLSQIDWLKCHKYACSSLVKQACDLWNSDIHDLKEISKIMRLSKGAVYNYLKQGITLNWCDYDPKQIIINSGKLLSKNNEKQIICLNTKQIFNSIKEALIYYNINIKNGDISQCCKNKYKYSGMNPNTGEYLQWQYYDEYLIKPKKLLRNEEIDKLNDYNRNKHTRKKVICLNNNKIFDSITEAGKYYSIKSSTHIGGCCKGERNYCGKDLITNKPLYWMYYEDYLKLNNENKDKIVNE